MGARLCDLVNDIDADGPRGDNDTIIPYEALRVQYWTYGAFFRGADMLVSLRNSTQ